MIQLFLTKNKPSSSESNIPLIDRRRDKNSRELSILISLSSV